ncbi:ead/Ea22-like family protein [Citrobacter portucalensis]|uniref:ead/Ea22-like family protein n=1 Tax=Citrobacter portucalensis TaxID=1639133 RepID=UPI003890FF98
MTALNKHAELRQLAEKASQGEWWSDVVETDGEYGDGEDRASGYHSYAVYVGSESLLDMTNSTASCIHEEWDHDYHIAWDETAKRNAEFIAAANPDTVLALLDELEAKDRLNTELIEKQRLIDICQGQGLEHRIAAEKRAETAEKRVAELEARTVTLPDAMMPARHNSGELFMSPDNVDYGGYLNRDDVVRNLRAAGIEVKGE